MLWDRDVILVVGGSPGVELIKRPTFTRAVHSTSNANKALPSALQRHQRAVSALPLTASAHVGLKLHGHTAWSGLECWRLVSVKKKKCVNYVGVEVSFKYYLSEKCGKLMSLMAQMAFVVVASLRKPHFCCLVWYLEHQTSHFTSINTSRNNITVAVLHAIQNIYLRCHHKKSQNMTSPCAPKVIKLQECDAFFKTETSLSSFDLD